MDLKELKKILKQENISENLYYLNVNFPGDIYSTGDKLCIGKPNEKWEVYYTEHGSKFDVKYFDSESGACEYFYNRIKQRNSK